MRAIILTDAIGLTRILHPPNGPVTREFIRWCEVTKVSAFKRDLFAYDLVCLVIESETTALELDGHMDGWDALVNTLPNHMPGMPTVSEWCEGVAKPAFATNMTLIFSRK